jgi:hypothetical protein
MTYDTNLRNFNSVMIGFSSRVFRLLIGKVAFFLVVISLAMPNTANANTIVTGEDLQKVCNDAERFSECVSYLETVYKTAKTIGRINEPQLKGLVGSCGPEQGIDTVPLSIAWRLAWQEYAAKYPGRLQRLAVEEVLLAYEERWPCKD